MVQPVFFSLFSLLRFFFCCLFLSCTSQTITPL